MKKLKNLSIFDIVSFIISELPTILYLILITYFKVIYLIQLIDLLASYILPPYVEFLTIYANIIDNVFSNMSSRNLELCKLDPCLSDHFAYCAKLK